jgi:predicted dehydrogenase
MIRIGIVGSDNSHALAFASLANVERVLGDQARVVAICGSDPEQTAAVARDGKIAATAERPEAMVDQIDLAVVVDRHGDLHAEHALPFLERGLPVFVDKPFAISLDDGNRMLEAAQRSGAAIDSWSALRFAPSTQSLVDDLERIGPIRAGHFTGPCDFDSPYGGPFFYATHVIELALMAMGEDATSVTARRSGNSVGVLVTWESGAIGSLTLLGDAAYHFHVSLFGAQGMAAREITGGSEAYTAALKRIVRLASGEGSLNGQQMLQPMVMLHAIQQSLREGGVEVGLVSPPFMTGSGQ